MDPILVWKAMAAHYSPFVWYRRLSVMFSRYTYINDLQKIQIDTPIYDDIGEDNIASLPPVVTVNEEHSSLQFLLDLQQMNALREAVLPPTLHHRPWKRIYSLSRDGDSFVAFKKVLEDWDSKQGDSSTLLLVKTAAGHIIGGFGNILASKVIGGAAGSCLFRLTSNKDSEQDDVVKVYGKNCLPSQKAIVFSHRGVF